MPQLQDPSEHLEIEGTDEASDPVEMLATSEALNSWLVRRFLEQKYRLEAGAIEGWQRWTHLLDSEPHNGDCVVWEDGVVRLYVWEDLDCREDDIEYHAYSMQEDLFRISPVDLINHMHEMALGMIAENELRVASEAEQKKAELQQNKSKLVSTAIVQVLENLREFPLEMESALAAAGFTRSDKVRS